MDEKDFCPYCGGEIIKGARKCKHCAEFLDENLRRIRADEAMMREPPPSNELAIAAVALGAVTLFTAGLTAIPAIICGALGMRRAKKHPLRPGYGLAVAGLVLGIVGLLFFLMFVAVLLLLTIPDSSTRVLESTAIGNLVSINRAAQSFRIKNGYYPESFRDIMETMEVIPERWNDDNSFVKHGYTFRYYPKFEDAEVTDYILLAFPLPSGLSPSTFLFTSSGMMKQLKTPPPIPTDYESAKELYEKAEEREG